VTELTGIARRVLLGPDFVARAAAGRAGKREEAWMLTQSREVRQSYVREVVDRGGHPVHAQIWMLRQTTSASPPAGWGTMSVTGYIASISTCRWIPYRHFDYRIPHERPEAWTSR